MAVNPGLIAMPNAFDIGTAAEDLIAVTADKALPGATRSRNLRPCMCCCEPAIAGMIEASILHLLPAGDHTG